jgi:hypothetical protein
MDLVYVATRTLSAIEMVSTPLNKNVYLNSEKVKCSMTLSTYILISDLSSRSKFMSNLRRINNARIATYCLKPADDAFATLV